VRIARIAQPDGFAFVAIDGEGTDPAGLHAVEIAGNQVAVPEFTGRRWPLADVRLLAPILPSKVVGVGKNYADHIKEMGGEAPADPVIFLKPSTAIIGPNVPIELPASSSRVDFEGELAVVVGAVCRDVPAAKANSVILGYTIANAGQGLRHVLPAGPVDRDRHRRVRRAAAHRVGRRGPAGLPHVTAAARHRRADRVDHPRDDTAAG
jgi:hypothetical protein